MFGSNATPIEDLPLAQAIGKSLVISAATTAGMMIGFAAAAVVITKIADRNKAKKNTENPAE